MARLIELLYLMLPAYLANMAPPFTKFWPGWNRPISQKWLGAHKTVIGFSLGVVTALFVACIQSRIDWSGSLWPASSWIAIGLAQGFGAMAGDSLKSLVKRRIGIAPGQTWIPPDQLDFPLGALLLLL